MKNNPRNRRGQYATPTQVTQENRAKVLAIVVAFAAIIFISFLHL